MGDASLGRLKRRLAALLAVSFVALGGATAFLLPPFYAPDERSHWLAAHHRVSKLSGGGGRVCSLDVALARHFEKGVRFRPEDKLPADLFAGVDALEPACEERGFYRFGNVLSYPGVTLARALRWREPRSGGEALAGFFVARLLQGLVVALLLLRLVQLAHGEDRDAPPGLLALLALALSPLFLQQSFAITTDVVVNGFSLCLVTWLVFPDRLAWFDRAAFVVLGLAAALTKPVLVPVIPVLLVLVLLFGAMRGGPRGPAPLSRALLEPLSRMRGLAAAALVIALLGAVYMLRTSSAGSAGDPDQVARQLAFAAEQPGVVLAAIGARLGAIFATPRSFVEPLGYMDTHLAPATHAHLVGLVGLLLLVEAAALGRRLFGTAGWRERLAPWRAPLAALLALVVGALGLSVLLVCFKMYLIATPLRSERLFGVQPRYFFPHLLVCLGLVMALGRTCLDSSSDESPEPRGSGRAGGPLFEAAALALAILAILGLASGLAADLLRRYG
jgi:hypothetical protein